MIDRRPHAEAGFVLVIVLALLVVLSLLAAATATSAERAIQAAQADSDRFQSELAMASTRETLLFLLATQRQTVAGLTVNDSDSAATSAPPDDPDGLMAMPVGNEIRLDGTHYQGLEGTRFALQDDRGLISVNWAAPMMRQAVYKSLGAPGDQWDGLDAKRLDYQDQDDLHRLNGAEKEQYERAGLPPPTNRPLATPLEMRRILGWDKLLASLDDEQLLSMFTMTRGADLNINTAPRKVLELLPGLTPENAQRMIELRGTTPFLSTIQVQQTFGIGMELGFEDGLTLFAKPSGNLILWDRHSGARQLLHWTLTPLEPNGPPWRIDYEVILPRGNESDQAVVGSPSTPLFSTPDTPGKQE